jgi:hypothetical protein
MSNGQDGNIGVVQTQGAAGKKLYLLMNLMVYISS